MRALTLHGPRDVRIERVDDPVIVEPTDVLVAVERAAICGSDLHVYEGRERPDPGTVMGHEFVGRVIETGADVKTFSRDERVLSPFTTNCGRCHFCESGLTARCVRGELFGWVKNGVGVHGGQGEMVRVPLADTTLRRAPETVSSEEALLLGDVLSTGWHCARMADVQPGGTYVVLGCGAVGLMAVVAACELGAAKVFAVDRVSDRLSLATHFGAAALSLERDDLDAVVRDATDGRGADAVLEAVGCGEATQLAYELVRPGGVISAVGVHHEGAIAFSPGQAYDKNLTYRAGRCPARRLMDEVAPLVESRRYDLSAVFTHRVPMAEGPQAYSMFAERRDACIKVALEIT